MSRSLFRRVVPKMPEGYYSGDKPNPNLRAFVEAHVREMPYDPETDDYHVEGFGEPQTIANRRDAVNDLHIYWSKKPYQAILQYIDHYTGPGDLVLDPFCGSGTTALAALMLRRKAVAIDRSPAATFITKNYCTPVDPDRLSAAFAELAARVRAEVEWLYETRCDRCGGKATTCYTVHSQVFECPRCMARVPLFDCLAVDVQGQGGPASVNACPHCHERGVIEGISTRRQRLGEVPVLVCYACSEGCRPVRGERRHNDLDPRKRDYFQSCDQAKLLEIDRREIPHWYPTDRMMHAPEDQECWGVKWRAGSSNFRTVDELFTRRSLWALSAVAQAIREVSDGSDELAFCLSGALFNATRMYQQREAGGGPAKGTYYTPPVFREVAVWTLLSEKVRNLERSAELWCPTTGPVPVVVSTESATSLDGIPSGSVDYIFTDPPYADKVQYGELNFVWEAWLRLDSRWQGDEIIVNAVRGTKEDDWAALMRQAIGECYRVLKPGRWLSLCYHDTSEGTWSLVQDITAEVGFVVDKTSSALFIETGQKAYNQIVADKVTKRDLVINFRKPKPGESASSVAISEGEDATTFREKVHSVVRDYLSVRPGSSKDRVYDEVVSRMVRAGQMEAHDFDELLSQVAEPVRADGAGERWYLRETEETRMDETEAAREDAAAASVSAYMAKWMASHPAAEGVHYSDLFEHFVYSVHDKPRREMAHWLPDYFYKTDEGTWRPPDSDEEQQVKSDGRSRGTNRRVRRYLSYLQQGLPVPERERPNDATLAEWLRHCKRSGLYEQGKLLYEKGGLNLDALTEETMVAADEDYQTCVRMLSREAATAKPKRRRRSDQESLEL